MDYDSNLIRFFILSALLPQCVMLYVLFNRKLYAEVPWFTLYLIFEVVSRPVLFVAYQSGNKWAYYYTAKFINGTSIIVTFMIILDILRNLLQDYPAIRRIGVRVIATAGLLLVIVAFAVAPLYVEMSHTFTKFFLVLQRSVRVIQLGLVVAICAFSSYLGITWRHYVFGIALGFGLYAGVDLAITSYVAQVGPVVAWKSLLIDQLAYMGILAMLTLYVYQPLPKTKRILDASHQEDLERWNRALAELRAR